MKSNRKWQIAVVLLILLPILIASVRVSQQIRQDHLNQALIAAVKKLDALAVVRLLSEGAQANARESAARPLTAVQIFARLLAQLQHKPSQNASHAGSAALPLLLTDNALSHRLEPQQYASADAIAAALIEHGADIHFQGIGEVTPLHTAALCRLHRTIRLLLSRGTSVHNRDYTGATPLMCAVDVLDPETVEILIQHGANVNSTLYEGYSVLYTAQVAAGDPADQAKIIRLLKQHGARLNAFDRKDLDGDTSETP